MAALNIQEITSKDASAIIFIKETMAALKFFPGLEDVECFLASDHPGIYCGELNGQPIATVSFTKYTNTYYSFGLYLVEAQYRGLGYGTRLFNKVFKEIDSSHNVSAYADLDMAKKYEKHGFRCQWLCARYEIDLTVATNILQSIPSNHHAGLSTKDINDIDQDALLAYDTAVFGYQRHSFIRKWINAKGSHSKVVTNSEGVIVGYGAARVTYLSDEGFRLGPLFADSFEAAIVLLKAIVEEIINYGLSSSKSLWNFCSTGKNSIAERLMELVNARNTIDLVFITTKGVPNGCFDKWFGITSPEIG